MVEYAPIKFCRNITGLPKPQAAVEVLSDASGAIHAANEAGQVNARQMHEPLMVLLQSNFAAVATPWERLQAVESGTELSQSDLGTSATQGRAAFQPAV